MSITIVGMGMGGLGTLTSEAQQTLEHAELLVGAERLLATLPDQFCTNRHSAVLAEEILDVLSQNKDKNIVVVMSGDVGFYSGAKKLIQALPDAILIPGVSSVQYFAAKLRRPWQDWKLVSAHGTTVDVVGPVRDNAETFLLTGGSLTVQSICQKLRDAGFGDCWVTVGENLGSTGERITSGRISKFAELSSPSLAVILIENPDPRGLVSCGLPDEAFIRGGTPMTKSEVRSVVLSKLRLHEDAVVYDIGAGTGSVSVEAALLAKQGQVYAFEREAEGCRLIRENAKKNGVNNLTVVEGRVPGTLSDLPVPDAAFIGGSDGSLEEILRTLLAKNPAVRLVVSAVALETLERASALFFSLPLCDVEIVQVTISRSKQLGTHHLMLSQNPVFIFSGTGKA